MKLKSLLLAGASVLSGGFLTAATINVSGSITSNTTWTADNVYLLDGYVFVTGGATLTINAGTVVKGKISTGEAAAALIVSRDGLINAVGTVDKPIIFTSELDDLSGNLGIEETGLWGGIILLGEAKINSRADGEIPGTPATDQIEGVSVVDAQIPLVTFGGTNDADSSGTMKYVSIRHGGADLGDGNEINGLTFGGVGSGTSISYIEVFANLDDGYEFFGGTVSPHHLITAYGNDDSFDMDSGFRGTLQYLFTIQADIQTLEVDQRGDNALEWDGATSPLTAEPKGDVTISNLTAIGIGPSLKPDGVTAGRGNRGANIRDNVTAKLYNSIFVNYAKAIFIESDIGTVLPDITNNIWFSHIPANNTAAGLIDGTTTVDQAIYFTDGTRANNIVDPMLRAIGYGATGVLDPRPAAGSPAWTNALKTTLPAPMTTPTYMGAFGSSNWAAGWTKLWKDGYLSKTYATEGSPAKFVNISTRGEVGVDAKILIGGFYLGGEQEQQLLVRAVGPGLANLNVDGFLADPVLEIYQGQTMIASNDDWSGTLTSSAATAVSAFALVEGSKDAAMVITLPPGGYTVLVRGSGGSTGIALVEVYEVD